MSPKDVLKFQELHARNTEDIAGGLLKVNAQIILRETGTRRRQPINNHQRNLVPKSNGSKMTK